MSERPIASVDEVREALRRRGYLDSGLDRFVLAGASARTPWRASADVGRRVGLAGGVVFGSVLALLAATLDSRLFSELRDLAVLWVYLALASGVTAGLLATVGGLVVSALQRRFPDRLGPGLPRGVGLAAGFSGLAYAALWWRSHAAAAPAPAQAVVLATGLAVALLLGRFGALASVAVLSAAGVRDLPEASLSRRQLLPLLAVALLILSGSLAAAAYFVPAPQPAPDFAVVPTGLRVRVVAVDGLERRLVERGVARGELPRLSALLDTAAVAPLRAEPERVPAIVWTTIATGRGPEHHGIRATGARRLPGLRATVPLEAPEGRLAQGFARAAELLRLSRPEPPTATLRGAKAFWNVASDKGLRVGIVNWWATWPAEPVNGWLVSDRALLRLERGGAADREVHPPEALERLRPAAAAAAAESERARRLDRFHVEAARALRARSPADLEAVYLNGLDVATMQRLGEAPALDPAALEARLDEVRAAQAFVDGLIGELAEGLGRDEVLLVVGDPGRAARRGPVPAEGLLLLAGGPVRPGRLQPVSERDLAPTVLHLLGLPVSRELEGRVVEEAFDPAFRSAHPVRAVASYGPRPTARGAEGALDRDVLEELRSLGYIR